tara:strand:+ start:660 stop:1223 length:564 start_codon:yes stop_codon:yes gene_type:complete
MERIPILYINLSHREDRNIHILKELKGFENIERIDAIKNDNGYKGCVLSHIKSLEYAKSKNYDKVIIMEDDFEFINREKFIYPDINFDVCMISGKIKIMEILNDNYDRVFDGRHTDCYLIQSHFYDTLINNFKEGYKKLCEKDIHAHYLDVYWIQLQQSHIFITQNIMIGRQMEDYSDIQKKIMKRY